MSGPPQRSDAEIIFDLYDGLVRFAAVVARVADDPDDLVHDALVRTIERSPLAELDNPQAYVRRAILNLASNRRRSLARRLRAVTRLASSELVEDHYPSDALALLDLAPQTRAVIWLADVEGCSFADIAAALDISQASARQRASRGRKQLRTQISLDIDGVAP